MAVRRIGLALILGAALFAVPAAFAQQTNQEDSAAAATDAYAAMTQADESRDNEDWAGAISGYRDALGLYRRLAISHPEWEPETVRYRIGYCANQIEMIGRTTGQSASELVTNSTPVSPSDNEGYRERYFALLQENQYLRQRQVEMEGDTPGLQVSTNGSGEMERLKAENKELQDRLAAAAGSDAPAAEAAARIASLDGERAALAAENETLKQQLEQAITEGPAVAAELFQPADTREVLQRMHEGLEKERSGNVSVALGIYEQVLAVRPAYAEALKAKGRCLLQYGKFDEAVAILRAVAFANRDDAQACVLLGTAYCLAGKYSPAVEVLTPLVVNDPSNARAQNALGAAWMGLGDKRSARTALEKAVSLDPDLADAHFNLAQVLLGADPAGDDKARQHYRKAIALGAPADEELAKKLGAAQ